MFPAEPELIEQLGVSPSSSIATGTLARYKTPVAFHDVGPSGFPRNAMGKIHKRELRASL